MRALVAIAFAAVLAAWVGAQFSGARQAPAAPGTDLRARAAGAIDQPAVASEPGDEVARDAPIAELKVAPAPIAVLQVAPTPATTAAPPHPAAVAEETTESVVALPTDLPPPLLIPVVGVEADELSDTFAEARAGGPRPHDAIDIMAPAGTPVVAVADGRIVKLFLSERGGITVYQFDASERFVYYYAHLQAYAPGLAEGKLVRRGEPIGMVGSTGNANPAAPHLHFAAMVLGPEKRWWEATAINPYPLLIAPEGERAEE